MKHRLRRSKGRSPAWLRTGVRRRRSLAARGRQRPFRFEPLEGRLLLAADLASGAHELFAPPMLGDVQMHGVLETAAPTSSASAAQAEGEGGAEGEAAQDLVAFAQALAASGTRFYGAAWCPHCTAQKELFEDGGDFLPFIEVTNLDDPVTLNAVGRGEDLTLNPTGRPVTSFPTWEFPDGSRLEGQQTLATLSQRSGVAIPSSDQPFIAPIDDGDLNPNDVDADGDDIVNLSGGSPLHIPLDGYDPGGGPLTYTVSSSNPALVSATLLQGNRSMLIDVAGWGKMNIQLFEQRAPRPTSRLIELAQADFYDGVPFHRIVNGFVIQGGDPSGTGGGGSPLGDFDDQFHEELQHNRSGTLSYAKSSDDTNDSQFFITEGVTPSLRNLDGNHSVSGVLVEGEMNREAISNNSTENPRDVVMNSVDIFTDNENAVVMLAAAEGASGSATVTVTATDADGNQFTRSFTVDVQPDAFDTLPWMDDFGDFTALEGATLSSQIPARDVEGNAIQFGVVTPQNFSIGLPSSPVTPMSPAQATVTITPDAGFIGSEEVTFYVYDPAQADLTDVTVDQAFLNRNSSFFDVQTVTVTSLGLDLLAESDSGASDSDNLTNVSAMKFAVTGVTPGATVDVRSFDTVIGSAQAIGSTVEVTTNILLAGGDGAHAINVTQTIGGQVSNPTPSLIVTYDSTGPTFTSTPPGIAEASQPFTYDAQTDDESGAGASYAHVDPATGDPIPPTSGRPVVNPATGNFGWTPGFGDIGTQTFAIRAADLAANETIQVFDLEVVEPTVIRYRLEVTKDGQVVSFNNPLMTGDDFQLNVFTDDVRNIAIPAQGGVFSGYLDVLYEAGLAAIAGPIVYGASYGEGQSGITDTPGIIDRGGAFASSISPLGQGERLLFSVPFTATASGTLNFVGEPTTDPSDPGDAGQSPLFDSGVYNNDDPEFDKPVCPGGLDVASGVQTCFGTMEFVNTTVLVDARFGIQGIEFQPEEDSADNPIDIVDVTINPLDLALTFTGMPEADHGTVTVANGATRLLYTPDPDYTGADEIRFSVTDGSDTISGTQSLFVFNLNDPPTAVDDEVEVDEDATEPVFIDVLANDLADPDPPSEKSRFRVDSVQTTSDQGGTVAIQGVGLAVTYLPPPNFQGIDTFTYVVSDRDPVNPLTDTGTVTVTVRDINDPPTATPDKFGDDPAVAGDEDNPILEDSVDVELDVLANDSSAPDDGEVISLVPGGLTQPANGSVKLSDDGSRVLYTPDPDFFGQDSFTYTITDDDPEEPRTAITSAIVHVTNTNDPPTANNDDNLVVKQDTSANSLDLLANDSFAPDPPETLTITGVADVSAGVTVEIAPGGGSVLYTPAPGFLGSDSFTYTIRDPGGLTSSATATVQVVEFDLSSLSGFVYIDANNDGIKQAGERPLQGVTITLSGTDTLGAAVNRTTTTAADGSYTFGNLLPSNAAGYMLVETQPPADFEGDGIPLFDGKDTIGSQGGTVENDKFTIVLGEGVDGIDNNFGELKGGTLNVLLANAAARRNGPFQRVPVQLMLDGQLQGTKFTDGNGTAAFEGVLPGAYGVEISGPFLRNMGDLVTVGEGGAVVTVTLGEPDIDAIYPTYLDSLSSRSPDFANLAVSPGEQHWRALGPGWQAATDVQVQLAADGSSVDVTIVDDAGTFTGTIATSHPLVRVLNALPDGTRRIRLNGSLAAFKTLLTPVANGSAPASEGESSSVTLPAPSSGSSTAIVGSVASPPAATLPATSLPPLVQPVLGPPTPVNDFASTAEAEASSGTSSSAAPAGVQIGETASLFVLPAEGEGTAAAETSAASQDEETLGLAGLMVDAVFSGDAGHQTTDLTPDAAELLHVHGESEDLLDAIFSADNVLDELLVLP